MSPVYFVQVGGQEYRIALDIEDGRLRVTIGDRTYLLDLVALDLDHYSLLVNNRSYDVYVEPAENAEAARRGKAYTVTIEGVPVEATVQSERAHRLSSLNATRQAANEQVTITAPMPGLVRNLTVAVGDAVEAGQRLLGLEAMKMENDIRAPQVGVIKQIQVEAGQTVNRGQVLIVIGPREA